MPTATLDDVRLEHAAIWTRDLDGLKQFYERYLGARKQR